MKYLFRLVCVLTGLIFAKTAAVRQQICHGKFCSDPGIMHPEFRDVGTHAAIPGDAPLVDKYGQRGGRECLGVGRYFKQGVAVDEPGISHFPDPVPSGVHGFAMMHDPDRHARHREPPHRELSQGRNPFFINWGGLISKGWNAGEHGDKAAN